MKFYQSIIVLLLTTLVSAFMINVNAAPAHAVSLETTEKKIVQLHNKARKAHNVKALKMQKCVDKWAERQARKQARQNRMFHQDLNPIAQDCKMYWVGENVAYGYTSAKAVHKAWMKSPGHKANILRKQYSLVGSAVAKSKNGTYYYAVVFGSK